MPRVVLLLNHVLASEPVATQRLRPHVGRSVSLRFSGWPGLLPPLPVWRFSITPAGLLEWIDEAPAAAGHSADAAGDAADLQIAVDAANPARLFARGLLGRRPAVGVSGDAAFANDVSWVADNVRWDIRDDLSRLVGDWPARELARSASALVSGLRSAVQGLMARGAAAARGASRAGGSGFGDAFGSDPASPAQPPAAQ